jgi:hypothetical protein
VEAFNKQPPGTDSPGGTRNKQLKGTPSKPQHDPFGFDDDDFGAWRRRTHDVDVRQDDPCAFIRCWQALVQEAHEVC